LQVSSFSLQVRDYKTKTKKAKGSGKRKGLKTQQWGIPIGCHGHIFVESSMKMDGDFLFVFSGEQEIRPGFGGCGLIRESLFPTMMIP
jgi:hypothetical protein